MLEVVSSKIGVNEGIFCNNVVNVVLSVGLIIFYYKWIWGIYIIFGVVFLVLWII